MTHMTQSERLAQQLRVEGLQLAAEKFLEMEDKLKDVTTTMAKLAKRIEKLETKGKIENV